MKNTISCFSAIQLLILVIFSCKGTNQQPATLSDNLLSDLAAKASCVFMTTDRNGIPAVSWVEEKEGADPKMFFAVWQENAQKIWRQKRNSDSFKCQHTRRRNAKNRIQIRRNHAGNL